MKKIKLTEKEMSLLIKVCEIQSSMSLDSEINLAIKEELSQIKGVSISEDDFGNIYATKGAGENGYKAIVSHTDTVHAIVPNRVVFEIGGSLVAMARKPEHMYGSIVVKQVGVGGDDKAGVFKCLKALNDFDDIKAVFFRFEESGCIGSGNANMDFFSDCNFVLQSDRRGNSDFITTTNGIKVASKEFEKEAEKIFSKYGFKIGTGSSTDVGRLKHKGLEVSCANISSGYYNAHSDSETINIADLENSYSMISEIFESMGNRKFPHKKEIIAHTTYTAGARNYYSQFPVLQSLFTSNINNNYFASSTIDVNSNKFHVFENIAGTNAYKLVIEKSIKLVDDMCPDCKTKDSITYFTDCGVFYCEGECMDTIDFYGGFEEVKLDGGDSIYVYDRANDLWYKESESIYVSIEDRYVLKEQLIY